MIPWARYVDDRKGAATFSDATRMKLFGFSRSRLELHVEVERLHVGGEVLWLVGLHVEVRCCDLNEQVDLLVRRWLSLLRRGVHPVC